MKNKITNSISENQFKDMVAKQQCESCIDWQGKKKRCPKHTICTEEWKGRYRPITYDEYKAFGR